MASLHYKTNKKAQKSAEILLDAKNSSNRSQLLVIIYMAVKRLMTWGQFACVFFLCLCPTFFCKKKRAKKEIGDASETKRRGSVNTGKRYDESFAQ